MVSSSPPRPLRWIVFGRHCSRRRSRRGGRRGRIVVVVSPSPSSLAEDQRAEACGRGPRLSPSLRYYRGWHEGSQPLSYLGVFGHARTQRGQNLLQFRQRYGIAPHVRYAVASRKNTDSLVKGMILLDEGGGKRGGGIKVFDENGAPVSLLSACFFWVLALGFFLLVSPAQKKSRKLAGNSSTGPPILGCSICASLSPHA